MCASWVPGTAEMVVYGAHSSPAVGFHLRSNIALRSRWSQVHTCSVRVDLGANKPLNAFRARCPWQSDHAETDKSNPFENPTKKWTVYERLKCALMCLTLIPVVRAILIVCTWRKEGVAEGRALGQQVIFPKTKSSCCRCERAVTALVLAGWIALVTGTCCRPRKPQEAANHPPYSAVRCVHACVVPWFRRHPPSAYCLPNEVPTATALPPSIALLPCTK